MGDALSGWPGLDWSNKYLYSQKFGYKKRVSSVNPLFFATYLTMLKPPVQAICSLAARVICRKPVASSSLARFKAPASNTRKGLSAKASLMVTFASWSSLARRTVVGRSPIFPLCRVAAKVVLKPLTTLESGSQDWSKLILDLCSFWSCLKWPAWLWLFVLAHHGCLDWNSIHQSSSP